MLKTERKNKNILNFYIGSAREQSIPQGLMSLTNLALLK